MFFFFEVGQSRGWVVRQPLTSANPSVTLAASPYLPCQHNLLCRLHLCTFLCTVGNSSSTNPTLSMLTAKPSITTIDVLAWLSCTTFDDIGEASMIVISTHLCRQCPFLGIWHPLIPSPPGG